MWGNEPIRPSLDGAWFDGKNDVGIGLKPVRRSPVLAWPYSYDHPAYV
jgi:hypothetical protein